MLGSSFPGSRIHFIGVSGKLWFILTHHKIYFGDDILVIWWVSNSSGQYLCADFKMSHTLRKLGVNIVNN